MSLPASGPVSLNRVAVGPMPNSFPKPRSPALSAGIAVGAAVWTGAS